MPLPERTRVSGLASALLGVAGLSLAAYRPLLCGGPTYYFQSPSRGPTLPHRDHDKPQPKRISRPEVNPVR